MEGNKRKEKQFLIFPKTFVFLKILTIIIIILKTVGKASEQHRLKCRDGTDETDDLQRYSSMSGGSSGENAVDTLLAKV